MNSWSPPASPHSLLQELLWPNEWKVLVACLLLNLTSRKQVDSVVDEFFKRYPTPKDCVSADSDGMYKLLKPLGLVNKRIKTLKRFSDEYLNKDWSTPKELYGCGKYADDAWHIFCKGDWRNVEPSDHALNNYHEFLRTIF